MTYDPNHTPRPVAEAAQLIMELIDEGHLCRMMHADVGNLFTTSVPVLEALMATFEHSTDEEYERNHP